MIDEGFIPVFVKIVQSDLCNTAQEGVCGLHSGWAAKSARNWHFVQRTKILFFGPYIKGLNLICKKQINLKD